MNCNSFWHFDEESKSQESIPFEESIPSEESVPSEELIRTEESIPSEESIPIGESIPTEENEVWQVMHWVHNVDSYTLFYHYSLFILNKYDSLCSL